MPRIGQATHQPACRSSSPIFNYILFPHSTLPHNSATMDTAPVFTSSSSDVAFPRGGASVLTPVQLKTIANKAAEDVLFEQNSKKRAATEGAPKKAKKAKKRKADAVEEPAVEIAHLTFRNVVEGAEVLGQIKSVGKRGLTLALSNNLVAFVPLTSISSEISAQLEQYAAAHADSDDEQDEQDTTLPQLTDLFSEGQWIRGVVLPRTDRRKIIDVTVVPEHVNARLERADIVPGNLVQGSVSSIEDHGVVFTLGLNGLSGFLPKKELKKAGQKPLQYRRGQVYLLSVAGADARAVLLRPLAAGDTDEQPVVTTISTVDAVHAGALVKATVAEVRDDGVAARLFSLADASLTLPHAMVFSPDSLRNQFRVGSTFTARVIAVTRDEGAIKFVLSRETRVLAMVPALDLAPLDAFPSGFVLEEAKVLGSDEHYIYFSTGSADIRGQAHKSHADPAKEANIEYPVNSRHRARVLGLNAFDGLLRLTLNPAQIDAKHASVDDIVPGELIPAAEVTQVLPDGQGVCVRIFGQFDASVPASHLSDIRLVIPERKFKVGAKFKGRVWQKMGRKIVVTLRKSLVGMNDDAVVSVTEDLVVGKKTTAVVERVVRGGAVVSLFNHMRAFLPNSELSETYVANAATVLTEQQAVAVRILSFDAQTGKISVTLRQAAELSELQVQNLAEIIPGRTVARAEVVEKTKECVVVALEGSGLCGLISTCHLADATYEECRVRYKALSAGSSLEVVLLEKDARSRAVVASAKKSLINAAKLQSLPVTYDDLSVGATVAGYIKSVTSMGLFVLFANKLVGLVLPRDAVSEPGADLLKHFFKDQSVSCEVVRMDAEKRHFLLALNRGVGASARAIRLKNPVDASKKLASDFMPNDTTVGVVEAVIGDHVQLRLADNLVGRVHASQCLDSWESITHPAAPLQTYGLGQQLRAKVIGFFNEKLHCFLVSGSVAPNVVVELSCLASELANPQPYKPAALGDFAVGSEHVVFIDRFDRGVACVNVAPGVAGQVELYNLSADAAQYRDFARNFPAGAALRLHVIKQDFKHGKLVFSAAKREIQSASDLAVGDQVPARIFRVTDSYLLLELGNGVSALSDLHEALSDYDQQLADLYQVDQAVLATVTSVDGGKLTAGLRDEKNAKDRFIRSAADVKRGNLVKGFIKSIADIGLHVALGRNVGALVRVRDISDAYLADWKKFFRPNQCITGKVSQNKDGRILLTLKESEVNGDLTSFKTFDELAVGQKYDGSVKLAKDFGVFVKLDDTANISGLCHRSEISDNVVENALVLFASGDRVKVIILNIDREKRQLSLGMKASYFTDVDHEAEAGAPDAVDMNMDDVDMADAPQTANTVDTDESESESDSATMNGLSTHGFDWTASILDQVDDVESSDDDTENFMKPDKKKRKQKAAVHDQTAEINSRAPQSVGDFQRLLVGNPNSSVLWMNYMSFQLQLGEIDKSREIAERALRTINYREEKEKLNIWIAILNLENSFGSHESLQEAFKRAVQHMDALTMHQKLIGIYLLSEKYDEAEDLFRTMCKKFSQNVAVWVQNASFYLKRHMPDEAHQILARALQVLPKRDHIEAVRKFGQLEFNEGDPEQGRSLFEGLITDAPKRIDLLNVYLDQEIKQVDHDRVEALFERVFTRKLSKKQAKFFFSKWLAYEENRGDEQGAARVKALAIEFVQKQSKDEE